MALKVTYGFAGPVTDVHAVLDDFWSNFRFRDDVLGEPLDEIEGPVPAEVRRFAEELVVGIADHLEPIDGAISSLSTNWTVGRMARVDRALLRLAAFELLYCPDTPASVILNEAIEIAKRYGTKESPAFVNGLLDQLAKTHRKELR